MSRTTEASFARVLAPRIKCSEATPFLDAVVRSAVPERLDDGFAITWFELEVREVVGGWLSPSTRLALPGARFDDGTSFWVSEHPTLEVGQRVGLATLPTHRGPDTVRMAGGTWSFYVGDGAVEDPEAWLWWAAPRASDGAPAGEGELAEGESEVEVARAGVPWSELMDAVRSGCQRGSDTSSAPSGADSSAGGVAP